MRFFTSVALLLCVATGCSTTTSRPENELFSNDFESLEGWTPDNPSLTREKAHSGQYSIKTQTGIDFNLTYKNVLGRIAPIKAAKIRVTAYVFITKPTTASLTVQILRSPTDDAAVFYQSINLGSEVKAVGEWTKVSKVFDVPAAAEPTNQLRIYMWGAGSDDVVHLDDLQVSKE